MWKQTRHASNLCSIFFPSSSSALQLRVSFGLPYDAPQLFSTFHPLTMSTFRSSIVLNSSSKSCIHLFLGLPHLLIPPFLPSNNFWQSLVTHSLHMTHASQPLRFDESHRLSLRGYLLFRGLIFFSNYRSPSQGHKLLQYRK